MTAGEFNDFLIYSAGLSFLMAALNTYLVFKRGRSWAIVSACIIAGATLLIYRAGAEKPALIFGCIGIFVSLVLDMVHRAGQPKSGGPTS